MNINFNQYPANIFLRNPKISSAAYIHIHFRLILFMMEANTMNAGSKPFDILIVFLKEMFEKVNFEKKVS